MTDDPIRTLREALDNPWELFDEKPIKDGSYSTKTSKRKRKALASLEQVERVIEAAKALIEKDGAMEYLRLYRSLEPFGTTDSPATPERLAHAANDIRDMAYDPKETD